MDPIYGGPCQGIRNAVSAMQKLGVTTEVVSLDSPNKLFEEDSFKIHALGPSITPWGYSSKLIPWLLDNISNYDVIVIDGLWQYYTYAVYKAVDKLKRKIQIARIPKYYVMPHGMLDPYFQKAPDRKFKAIRNLFFWKFCESKVVNNADGVLFTCEQELKLAMTTFDNYKPKAAINIGYGIVAPPKFQSEMTVAFYDQCPDLKEQDYLLFLSRINPKKGVDILVRGFKEYFATSADQDIPKLVIAGPGLNTPLGIRINNMVKEDEMLREKVYFPGMLKGDAKWGAFYNCKAFVLPSHQENFGIAVVEALACGKPVLISDKVNIWSEIKNGNAGLIVEDSLKGVKEFLINWDNLNDLEKKQIGLNASETFYKYFATEPATLKFFEAISNPLK